MALSGGHVYISRKSKLARLVGAEAVRIAKEKNDPLYKKLLKYKKMWKLVKEKIVRKYRGQALQRIRKKLAGLEEK